jgi:hypothetical protein
LVRLANSSNATWTVRQREIPVGLAAPSDLTYTEYKLWGYGSYPNEGSASWQSLPASGTVNITIDDEAGLQVISARFRDAGETESSVVTASGVIYEWTEPSKSGGLSWVSLTDEGDQSAILRSAANNTDITFDKNNLDLLKFHNRDFSGLTVVGDKITVTSGSQIYKVLDLDYNSDGYASIKKTFATSATPFITVDTGAGHKTLTTYSGAIKSDVTGNYLDRVDNYSWNSGSKELNFDVYKFSQYGFATINALFFTTDSVTAGYNNTSIALKVQVLDTNGEGVENAPVTFSGTGDDIGDFSANPVYTDGDGIATATLNLDTLGTATYDASCDGIHTLTDQVTYCYDYTAGVRSILNQYTQIKESETFDDSVSGVNNSNVAEPTVSGCLNDDLNVVRSIKKQIKGTSYWYSDLGNYFDPTNTDAGDAANKDLNLSNISGNTLDSKTIILAVEADNSGSGFSISTNDTGFVYSTGLSYATPTNRLGLPIFASTTNSGSYYDEGGADNVCVIDLIDSSSGVEFEDGSGNLIYAKFHDGADAPTGSGVGTDVWVKFYANDAPYTWTADDPSLISMIFPYRRRLSDMEEYNWSRTDFVNGFEGDANYIDDVENLWSFTGASNGVLDPTWTNTSGYYPLDGDPDDLMEAINDINDIVGNLTYTSTYIVSGETVTASLNKLGLGIESNDSDITTINGQISSINSSLSSLQTQIWSNDSDIATNASGIDNLEAAIGSDTGLAGLIYSSNNAVTDNTSIETAIGALDAAVTGSSGQKYIEELVSDITTGVEHATPISYTPNSTAGQEGINMDVWLNGQLLAASTGANGVNADRDYSETTTSGITFTFDISSGETLMYVIRQ